MGDLPVLGDLAVIFVVAVAVVAVLQRFGIPSIAGFIVAGAIAGPKALGIVDDSHEVEVLAEVGVALLLFGIGLELNLSKLRKLWKPVVIGGALQVGITIAVVLGAGMAFGLALPQAMFLGFVIAVSSTAIVLRGLESRGEVDAPHGQLTLGVLVFQDLAVVPMMLAIPLLAGSNTGGASIAIAAGKTVAILVGIVFAARLVVPRMLHWVARTRQRELFVLMVFVVSLGTAWVVTQAGISLGLGAFLAGLVVAGSEYRHQAIADLMPFREVLTSLFFVSIGMLFDIGAVASDFGAIVALLLAIMVGKFTIVMLAGTAMRLPATVSALAGAALCQVGEFAFVLQRGAEGTNLLDPVIDGRLRAASIISMIITPLAILLGPHIAAGAGRVRVLQRFLGVPTAEDANAESGERSGHVILAGYGIAGQELAICLRECGIPYVIVDLNPDNVRKALDEGEPVYFGDITSREVLEHLGAARAKEIVLAINNPDAAERSIGAIRSVAPHAHLVVRARYMADVEPLKKAGATKVIPAELEAAVHVAAHVLGRRRVPQAQLDHLINRIRTRQKEDETRDERLSAVPSISP